MTPRDWRTEDLDRMLDELERVVRAWEAAKLGLHVRVEASGDGRTAAVDWRTDPCEVLRIVPWVSECSNTGGNRPTEGV